jgi:hypothetical protein
MELPDRGEWEVKVSLNVEREAYHRAENTNNELQKTK